jgi:hypothetical protein
VLATTSMSPWVFSFAVTARVADHHQAFAFGDQII